VSAWPSSVWNAPLLRGVDVRGRDEIVAAGRLRKVAQGDRVFGQGVPADSFFIVVEGEVTLRAIDSATNVRDLRSARAGDSFGEEGLIRIGASRPNEAIAASRARIAEVPLVVFRRAITRTSRDGFAKRVERTIERALTRDLLLGAEFARSLGDHEIDRLLDAAEHRSIKRGEILFRKNEPATHVAVIGSGIVELVTEDDRAFHVHAALARGALLTCDAASHATSAIACGDAWMVLFARDAFVEIAGHVLEGARVATERTAERQRSAVGSNAAETHPIADLHRFVTAQSLLVIDGDACTRCGHCATSCSSAHPDGVARLLRRGDRIDTRGAKKSLPLLLPTSCQHCASPSCMLDCPTGAIERNAHGDVLIREELCTGCGNCAKGCPWGNIQMSPRVDRHEDEPELVATKCDLCRGVDGGPACVAACPTQAIVRIRPAIDLPEVRALVRDEIEPNRRRLLIARTASWPWTLLGAAIGSVVASIHGGQLATGLTAGVTALLLVAYAAVKRRPRAIAAKVKGRTWFVAHVAIGFVAVGAVIAHCGSRVPSNAAGALAIAFWMTAFTGIFGALAYRVIPERLSRVSSRSMLPEEFSQHAADLDAQIFGALSGKGESVKWIYARIVGPYARSWFGGPLAAVRGLAIADEEARLRSTIQSLTQLSPETRDAVDAIVRVAVARRAIRAEAFLHAVLRGWSPIHAVFTAITIVLLVFHVVVVVSYR
jgi:Fe-S-cluster-containing dehydrogenase component/CRP-like cAMP-binding protein